MISEYPVLRNFSFSEEIAYMVIFNGSEFAVATVQDFDIPDYDHFTVMAISHDVDKMRGLRQTLNIAYPSTAERLTFLGTVRIIEYAQT